MEELLALESNHTCGSANESGLDRPLLQKLHTLVQYFKQVVTVTQIQVLV